MNIRIAGRIPCSFVNGFGARHVIFVQGCPHACPKCQNQDTWDPNGGYLMSTGALAKVVLEAAKKHPINGITISGGEPMGQSLAVLELIDKIKHERPNFDVWMYTGYELKDLPLENEIFERIDYLVTGPYRDDLKCEGHHYGSSNQSIWHKVDGKWIEVD